MLRDAGQTRRVETVLRRFVGDDQHAVRELVLAGLAEHWGTPPDPSFNRDLDDIATSYAHGTTLVAVRADGAVVGTGTVVPRSPGTAEIVRMSVSTELRGRGIGRELLAALIDIARAGWGEAPINTVVLETTSAWHDTVGFYKRCGFTITHRADGEFGEDTWFEMRMSAQR